MSTFITKYFILREKTQLRENVLVPDINLKC